jgi:hypothetical protein
MSSGDSERSHRDRGHDEASRAREPEFRLPGGSHDPLHPAPPAEGKWRGILGEVRDLIARRRRARRRSQDS